MTGNTEYWQCCATLVTYLDFGRGIVKLASESQSFGGGEGRDLIERNCRRLTRL